MPLLAHYHASKHRQQPNYLDTVRQGKCLAGMRRYKCCGWDITWLAKLLPCCPWVPPEWWLGYSRRQRRAILTFAAAGAVMLLVLALVVAAALAIMHAGPRPGAGRASGGVANLSSKGSACAWAQRRLPPGVRPRLYRLAIQTDLKARAPAVPQGCHAVTVAAALQNNALQM